MFDPNIRPSTPDIRLKERKWLEIGKDNAEMGRNRRQKEGDKKVCAESLKSAVGTSVHRLDRFDKDDKK
jgi:hypothetical protein